MPSVEVAIYPSSPTATNLLLAKIISLYLPLKICFQFLISFSLDTVGSLTSTCVVAVFVTPL